MGYGGKGKMECLSTFGLSSPPISSGSNASKTVISTPVAAPAASNESNLSDPGITIPNTFSN